MTCRKFCWALVGFAGLGLAGCQTRTGAVAGIPAGRSTGITPPGRTMERSPAVANGSPTRVHETLVHHHPVVDDYAARPARSVEPLYGMERDSIDRRADADTVQVSQTDVMDWTRRGVREDVIIDRIERNNARFKLSATDQNRLRDAGVSEEVIRTMCDSARR